MIFEYPYLLVLLPFFIYCLYKCRKKLESNYFVHLSFFSPSTKWYQWERLLKILVITALFLALASPVLVDEMDPLNRKGIDIVLSLDGSGSMNASGFDASSRASRFEITQKIAQEFVLKRYEDNVGVVLFGDFAFIASPITYEKEIVSEMIGYLSHGMAGQNTAIGEGIAMGVRALERSKAKSKIIILLTDGEHNSGRISPKDAVELASQAGIKIYTIGIGNKGEFDQKLLETIAEQSGGEFFGAYNSDELESAYTEIDSLEQSNIKSRSYQVKAYYFQWVLAFAYVLLLYLLWQRSRA